MYSFHLHKHKKSLSANKKVFKQIDRSLLSQRAHLRIEEWKTKNTEIAESLYGKTQVQKLPGLRKPARFPSPSLSTNRESELYKENDFQASLREINKDKHIGPYYLKINYLSTQDRLSNSIYLNSSLDSSPRTSPVPPKLQPFSIPKPSVPSPKTITPDPYFNPQEVLTFRMRRKSLEKSKPFFVTTKIPSPKSNLLISKKFDTFYSSLKGSKLYKNSIV